MSSETNIPRPRIVWIDAVRILACFLVVVSHSCDRFVGQLFDNYPKFLTGSLVGSLVRPCVPLFVMISGYLLLPCKYDMGTFYRKRTRRLLWPFVFWALAAPLMYFLYVHSGWNFVGDNLAASDFTANEMLHKMYGAVFNFNYDTTPLWYMYMLIGLYLLIPILSGWLKQATQHELKTFLYIWTITLFIPYLQIAAPYLGYHGYSGNQSLFGVCDWNVYGTFYYFSGFIGYLVLAYYLKKYPLQWSIRRLVTTSVLLFTVGYGITASGFLLTAKLLPGNFAALEIIWNFTGINVAMMTFAVYILMQRVSFRPRTWISKTASLTLGIFLSHFIFVQIGHDILYPALGTTPPLLKILLTAVTAFALSLLLVWLMSLVRILRRVVE